MKKGREILEKGREISKKGREISKKGSEIQRKGRDIREKGHKMWQKGREKCEIIMFHSRYASCFFHNFWRGTIFYFSKDFPNRFFLLMFSKENEKQKFFFGKPKLKNF